MKHLLLGLLGASLSLSAHAQAIYSTDFNSQDDLTGWQVIDANNDGSTWVFSESNTDGERTYYGYNSTNAADDWLISPAITPTVSGNYLVSYTFMGSSYGESLKMYYGNAQTIAALSQNLAAEYATVGYSQQTGFFFVQATAGEPLYVAFYACSPADRYRLYAKHLEVKLCENPVDLSVTELVSPVSGDDLSNETVKLKIANNGLVAAAAGSYKVTITVDDNDVFTETINREVPVGGEIEVTLTNTIDLSQEHHTFNIKATVYHSEDISAGNDALTTSVRHYGAVTEPYIMGFEPSDDTADIKFFNLNEDKGYWSLQTNSWMVSPSRTGVRSMCYNYSKDNSADDWAILDGIRMKPGHHVLKFWVSTMDDSHTEAFSIFWGNEATPTAMKNQIAEFDPITQAEYLQKIVIFDIDEEQVVYIGFHATSPADQNWIAIDDLEVNSISADDVDIVATTLSYPLDNAYVPVLSSKDVQYSFMNQGIVDVDAQITVKIDGEVVVDKNVTLVAQQDKTFTESNLLANVAPGKHTLEITAYNAKETNTDDNTHSASFTMVGDPDLSWNFEDGVVPESFTWNVLDSQTLTDDAVADVGEQGIGLMELYNHQYYGNYMLAVSTWFTESGYTDRFVILPKVHVDSKDAVFVFNSGASSEYYNEKYNVQVSTGSTAWYEFNDLFRVSSEDVQRKNRGASLAAYEGKDIYLCFEVTTSLGDMLLLDNIQLVGCSLVDNAVDDITIAQGADFIYEGDILTFGDFDSVKLSVYNMSGQLVYSSTGSTFSLSNLSIGVYVLKAETPKGVITSKIVK